MCGCRYSLMYETLLSMCMARMLGAVFRVYPMLTATSILAVCSVLLFSKEAPFLRKRIPCMGFALLPFCPSCILHTFLKATPPTSAAKKQGGSKSPEDTMKTALYLAFAEIIADNSAYDSANQKATLLWLDESLQGQRRYSVLGSMLN